MTWRGAGRTAAILGGAVGSGVLVGASAAVAVPHARRDGVTALTVAAGLVLVLSVLLLVAVVAAARRVVRGWRRPLAACGAAVVALLAIDVVTLPVAACTVPATAVGRRTPAAAGLPLTEVTTTTPDGVRLAGWYVPSTNGAAVVLLHGSGSTRSAVLDQAIVLGRNGFGVLALDARGHGRSAGHAMDFGWSGDADVAAGVAFLGARPEVDPHRIALVGLSMGGEEALGAAAADLRVRAVVAEGATGRQSADLRWLSDAYGWRGAAQEGIETAKTVVTRVLARQRPPLPLREAVQQVAPRPVLLIAAGSVADEQHAAADLRRASPSTVQVWTVPGSGHTQGLRTAPQQWEQRVVGFLTAATR
ncbi:MAG: alpha/beta hydrolase [Angustibacter sp.]